MGDTTIEWAQKVWNPVTGCEKESEGCRNCYAKALHDMRHKAYLAGKQLPKQYAVPFETVLLHPYRLDDPYHWKQRQRVFVNSMSDLFHPEVPKNFIENVFAVMALNERHTFMVLTKRPERMLEFVSQFPTSHGPIPNVWLGVSVEDQRAADERIPLLLKTPAAVRFVSCEPLLGPVNLEPYLQYEPFHENYKMSFGETEWRGVEWVITGGESGPNARIMHPDWARGLRDQCVEAKVPFFFKQWGEWKEVRTVSQETVERYSKDCMTYPNGDLFFRVGHKAAGRLLDGKVWNRFPEVTR